MDVIHCTKLRAVGGPVGVAEGGPLGGAVATITASLQLLHLVRDKPRQTGLLCTVLHLPYLLRMRRKITAHLTFIYCTKLMYGAMGGPVGGALATITASLQLLHPALRHVAPRQSCPHNVK